MSTMGTFSKDFTKSAGLIASPPRRKANFNDIPVLGSPAHLNFRGSNNKKKKKRQSWRRSSSCIRSHDYTVNEKRMQQGLMYRRQMLLASTSLPLKPQQMMMAAMPPPDPPILTDYQKLANAVQEAEKMKNTSHGRPELNDVVAWLSSSEPLKSSNLYKSPDELSGIVTVPGAQELLREINEKEVVTARVRRPAAFKLMKDKEEEVVLEGIEVTDEKPLCFDVYIRLGQDDDDAEELYAGTFSHMPPRKKQRCRHKNKAVCDGREEGEKRVRRCCLRLGMSDMITHGSLNAHRVEIVTVKLVPTLKVDEDAIKVQSIFIDYR